MEYNMKSFSEEETGWPDGEGYVLAKQRNNNIVKIPVTGTNVLVTGTAGYGKTVFTKYFVRQRLRTAGDIYAVFFQIKPDDFTLEFASPQDKIITYDAKICSQKQLFRWNLVKEIRQCDKSDWDSELEELAAILFQDVLQDPRNRIWADAAKSTFKGFVNVRLHCCENNPSNKELIDDMKNMNRKEFLEFLARYSPNHSILRDNFEYDPKNCEKYVFPKKASDIMFFLQNVLAQFGGTFMSEEGTDTIWDYLHGNLGKRLFIVHDYKKKDSCKIFERYFLKKIIDEMMSISSGFVGKNMLMVLDEVDKLEYEFGLAPAATLGRQFGLQIILATQSIESIYCIAPEINSEHITQASLAGYPLVVSFHPGDPQTIETLQKLYGNCRRQTMIMPLSRYDHPIMKVETEPIVRDEDFSSLETGECYVKYRSSKPERVKIII